MLFEKKPLSFAVSCALTGVAVSMVSMQATAQDATDEDSAETLEEVYVTGSRISRPNLDSASPVTVLTNTELAVTGSTDIGALLQRLPAASGSPIGTTTNNGGDGSVRVDLRGLGTVRTLTLVNGRRTVDQGDYQTIPSNMIERVEILKDGGSILYGTDAVAGVVNIITRDSYEGIEVTAQHNWFDNTNGADTTTVGIVAGKEFDGGNVVFGMEYVDQTEAFQRDTPWEFLTDSFYIYPEGCENSLLEPYGSGGCYRLGSSRVPQSRLTFVNQGRFNVATPASGPYQAGLIAPGGGPNYNYAPVNYFQTPFERTNVFATADFDLPNDIKFKSEFRGNVRQSAQELAPLPYASGATGDPGHNGVFDGVPYVGIHQNNYYLMQAVDRYNAATGAGLVYEPVRDARRRMIETNRRFEQDVTQFQFDTALEGEYKDVKWEVYANKGYQATQSVDFGQFSGVALNNALGPSADLDGNGRPECYTDISDASTLIAGCVPLNLFGGGVVDRPTGEVLTSSLTEDMVNYVSTDLVDNLRTEQTQYGFYLDGAFGELQGGEIGWAAGYNYRKEEGKFTPDSAKAQDAVTGNTGSASIGSLTNQAVFVEFLAPVFDNGTQSLEIGGGLRYDDFDAFDGDETYSLSVKFAATESLSLRSTYGTVFRAPSLFALYGGLFDGFPTVNDPCAIAPGQALPAGCAQVAAQPDAQILSRSGGNPNLLPETGETFTAGLVWTPEIDNHNLSFTVDYWDIQLEDGIGSLGAQAILDQCAVTLNQDACALITRSPIDYSVDVLLNGALNLTEQGAKGIDFELVWGTENDLGTWDAKFLWTHLLDRSRTPIPGDPEEDLSGRYTDPTAADGGARPEDKINASLAWGNDNGLTVTYLAEWVGGMDADTFCNCGAGNRPDGSYVQEIDSEIYHDLIASYQVNDNMTISGGITNITDEAPPFIEVGFNGGTDPATYREFGRGMYLRLVYEM